MKAKVNGTVVAEASEEDLIAIEGNWYFPPESVTEGVLAASGTPYFCPWKGQCQYFDVVDGDTVLRDLAWSYPEPIESSFRRVGRDYSNYVAFSPEVEIEQ